MRKNIKKILIQLAITFFFSILISILIILFFRGTGKISDYNEGECRINISVDNVIPRNSYGRQMRLTSIEINGRDLDLQQYSNDKWIWSDEYNYMLYEGGEGDSTSLIIDIEGNVDNVAISFAAQEGSGYVKISINGTAMWKKSMYSQQWETRHVNCTLYPNSKYIECLVCVFSLLVVVIFSFIYVVMEAIKRPQKDYGISSSLGMFDLAKGCGIITVIIGHSIDIDNIDFSRIGLNSAFILIIGLITVYGIMPMFFVMSGYGFRGQSIFTCVKQQMKYLLKPYCILALSIFIIQTIKLLSLESYTSVEYIRDILPFMLFSVPGGYIGGIEVSSIGPIWYCVALCIAWIILNIIMKLRNEKIILFVIITFGFIGYYLNCIEWRIGCLSHAMVALVYIYIGYVIKKRKILQKENSKSDLIYWLITAILIIFILYNGYIGIAGFVWGKNYGLGLLLSAIAGIVMLRFYLYISIRIKDHFRLIKRIGRDTYDILYIHTFEYLIIPWKEIISKITLNPIAMAVMIILLRFGVIFIIYSLLRAVRRKCK